MTEHSNGHHTDDLESQGEFPDAVPAGEYTASEIPGEPAHENAAPGTGHFTDSELAEEPDAAARHSAQPGSEGQYTDAELPGEPDAAEHHDDGGYTGSDH